MSRASGSNQPTLFDVIWARHAIREEPGGRTLLYVDRAVVDDVRAPYVFANMKRRGLNVRQPELVLVVQDHAVPSFGTHETLGGSQFAHATRAAAQANGLRLFDIGDDRQGISHVAAPESGFVLPGMSYLSVDSHAPTVGGIGALGFGCGSTEMEHVLATQTIWLQRPRQGRLTLESVAPAGTTAKDIILHALARFGRETLRGLALEFAGSASRMNVEARMTICNMAVEMGARTALVAPDERVLAWLTQRAGAQVGKHLHTGMIEHLQSAPDAQFDVELSLDCAAIAPQISWGANPSQAIAIDGCVPHFDACTDPTNARRACEYMGLSPGEPIAGKTIDHVFIGSCTNARFDDLAAAANILRGRRVADGVRAVVVPGSRAVARQAEASGIRDIFLASGFHWGEPGCSMCAGGGGEKLAPGARVVSTTNRNFENRQGPGVRTHLASPLTAAAAALTGVISDPRPLMPESG